VRHEVKHETASGGRRDRRERYLLSKALFRGLHEALMRRYMLWILWKGNAIDPTYDQVTRMVNLARFGEVGARLPIDPTRQLRIDYEDIIIEDNSALWNPPLLPKPEIIIQIPGSIDLYEDWRIHAFLALPEVYNARLVIREGADVRLRVRQPGDRWAPLGLDGHTQKLSEWLIDHKVPQAARDRLPLLTVDGEIAAILWGRQWPISENFAVKPERSRVVYFWLEHLR
jgi:tRNA(Ile)-lysidine synthetase-like protein